MITTFADLRRALLDAGQRLGVEVVVVPPCNPTATQDMRGALNCAQMAQDDRKVVTVDDRDDFRYSLAFFLAGNPDAFTAEEMAALRALEVGQTKSLGGGAQGDFLIRRVE